MVLLRDIRAMDALINGPLPAELVDECTTCKGAGEVLREVESFGSWDAFFPCEDCDGKGVAR